MTGTTAIAEVLASNSSLQCCRRRVSTLLLVRFSSLHSSSRPLLSSRVLRLTSIPSLALRPQCSMGKPLCCRRRRCLQTLSLPNLRLCLHRHRRKQQPRRRNSLAPLSRPRPQQLLTHRRSSSSSSSRRLHPRCRLHLSSRRRRSPACRSPTCSGRLSSFGISERASKPRRQPRRQTRICQDCSWTLTQPVTQLAVAARAARKHRYQNHGLSSAQCDAMLADPAGLLRKMWHAEPWKQRRKGEPACWERQREVRNNNARVPHRCTSLARLCACRLMASTLKEWVSYSHARCTHLAAHAARALSTRPTSCATRHTTSSLH